MSDIIAVFASAPVMEQATKKTHRIAPMDPKIAAREIKLQCGQSPQSDILLVGPPSWCNFLIGAAGEGGLGSMKRVYKCAQGVDGYDWRRDRVFLWDPYRFQYAGHTGVPQSFLMEGRDHTRKEAKHLFEIGLENGHAFAQVPAAKSKPAFYDWVLGSGGVWVREEVDVGGSSLEVERGLWPVRASGDWDSRP